MKAKRNTASQLLVLEYFTSGATFEPAHILLLKSDALQL